MNESDISLRSNFLLVQGSELRANVLRSSKSERQTVDANELQIILRLGRTSLLEGIEDFYESTRLKNPTHTVSRPSIWTAYLGSSSQEQTIFTDKGQRNNTGVMLHDSEIQIGFQDYWNAVRGAGFVPEVRRTTGSKDHGAWLLLKRPAMKDVLESWLDYSESEESRALRASLDSDQLKSTAERRAIVEHYRVTGTHDMYEVLAATDASQWERERSWTGLALACAALSLSAGDYDGYIERANDALDHAEDALDDGTMLAIHNVLWRT